MNQNQTVSPAAWIGWDWADEHHDLFVQEATGKTESLRLANEPGAMHAWLKGLRDRLQQQPVTLCVEAGRSSVLAILEQYAFVRIYVLNPKSLTQFRQAVRPSGAKNDRLDCRLACQFIKNHSQELSAHVAQDPINRELSALVRLRRDLVNERTALANKLTATLKDYYPLALELLDHDTTSALAANFILKFPTLRAVQQAKLHKVRQFFAGQRCHLTEKLQGRLDQIADATAVSTAPDWNNPYSFLAQTIAQQIKVLVGRIKEIEERIAILSAQHPQQSLAKSLPGAGPALESRIMVALAGLPESAQRVAVRSGVAPQRVQSGKTCVMHLRYHKPQFLHQTWVEYAKSSTLHCDWARRFLQAKLAQGKTYYTAIRGLAYKWMRILCACAKNGTPYDEARYLQSLIKRNSPYAQFAEAA